MRELIVLQNTESEFLGLLEDHLEGRNIRFRYVRPVTGSVLIIPQTAADADGLIVLGGGPWGAVSEPVLPGLEREVLLVRDFLDEGRPVIGIGLGAQILGLAADGQSVAHPFEFRVETCRRTRPDALNGFLPESFPMISYMRDRLELPTEATVLATAEDGRPIVFQVAGNCLGFAGHPGFKPGIIEDLLMEFDDAPEDFTARLEAVRAAQLEVADALVPIMTGVIQITGLMRPRDATGGNP